MNGKLIFLELRKVTRTFVLFVMLIKAQRFCFQHKEFRKCPRKLQNSIVRTQITKKRSQKVQKDGQRTKYRALLDNGINFANIFFLNLALYCNVYKLRKRWLFFLPDKSRSNPALYCT